MSSYRKEIPMFKRIAICLALSLVAVFTTAAASASPGDPGIRHSVFMAGSVIEASAKEVNLCIGTPEGAQVGAQLDVVRVTRDPGVNPKQGARFRWEKVGTIRIDAIVDEHFARATVVSGRVKKGDIAQLGEAAGKGPKS